MPQQRTVKGSALLIGRWAEAKKIMIRAALTPILCLVLLILVPVEGQGIIYQPLIFGLAVSIANLQIIKINRIVGVMLCIGLAYLIFFLAIYITIVFSELYSFIEKIVRIEYSDFTTTLSVLSGGVVAAIILYISYSYLFKDQKIWTGVLIILITTCLIPFTVWLFSNDSKYIENEGFAVYQLSWMIFITFGFGIALNYFEIKRIMNESVCKHKK